jgi:transposase
MTLEEENAVLRAENTTLHEQVQRLAAEVQELKGRLAKDSHNSSKPPSSDGLARTPKSLRTPSGKKPGGQLGHPGHRVRLVATPDAVVVHHPGRCGACQRMLPADAPQWLERRQVHELPPVRLQATEHQILHVRCPRCGATTAAAAPAGVSAPRQYGPRLRAVAAYLVQQQFIPYARVREVVADVFGAALSVGTLVNLVHTGSERLQAVEQEIKAALRQAPVLRHDETGLRVVGPQGAERHWTHVTCTPDLTHYVRHTARGAGALEAIGLLPAYTGVSMHDGWTSYRHYTACAASARRGASRAGPYSMPPKTPSPVSHSACRSRLEWLQLPVRNPYDTASVRRDGPRADANGGGGPCGGQSASTPGGRRLASW